MVEGLSVEVSPDKLEGPFSVSKDQVCTYCQSSDAVTVRNIYNERIYEICRCCGFEKDYDETDKVDQLWA